MLGEVIACLDGFIKIAHVTLDKDAEECTNQYVKHGRITVSAEATIVNYCTRNCAENSSYLDIVTNTIAYIYINSSDGVETQYLHQLGQLSGTIGTESRKASK